MKPIFITQTKNAFIVAVIFLIIFATMLSGLLFVDGLATWWFLLIIVGMAVVFYIVSLYTFVRMEFYDEAIIVRHLLKPKQVQQINWEHIKSIEYTHTLQHPHKVSVYVIGRKSAFSFSLMHETEEVRSKVLALFKEKGHEATKEA